MRVMGKLSILLMCALGCLPLLGLGAEVVHTAVERRGEQLIMRSETLIQASVDRVRAVLTDFKNLPQVNPGLKEVNILKRAHNGTVRMRVISQVCILGICLELNWIQEVHTLPNGDIVADIVPDQGDFRKGTARWRLLPEGGSTRLLFQADLTPNFWFPPLIGPWLIKRKLSNEALETARGIEKLVVRRSSLQALPKRRQGSIRSRLKIKRLCCMKSGYPVFICNKASAILTLFP